MSQNQNQGVQNPKSLVRKGLLVVDVGRKTTGLTFQLVHHPGRLYIFSLKIESTKEEGIGWLLKDSRTLKVRIICRKCGLYWELTTSQTALILRRWIKWFAVNCLAGGRQRGVGASNSQESNTETRKVRENIPQPEGSMFSKMVQK